MLLCYQITSLFLHSSSPEVTPGGGCDDTRMVEQSIQLPQTAHAVARSYSNWSQVQSGDVLVAVNGRNVRGSSIQAVAQVILGPIGSSVTPTPSSSILVTLHFLVLVNSAQTSIYRFCQQALLVSLGTPSQGDSFQRFCFPQATYTQLIIDSFFYLFTSAW